MFSSYYDWNNFATDKNPALTLFIVQNFPLPSFHSSFNIVMSGSKAPDFDAYGLFRATHSHVSAPLRSVLDMCHWHIAPYPIFAYRGIIIPLLCSYRGGS